jgi:hypothetical protein
MRLEYLSNWIMGGRNVVPAWSYFGEEQRCKLVWTLQKHVVGAMWTRLPEEVTVFY